MCNPISGNRFNNGEKNATFRIEAALFVHDAVAPSNGTFCIRLPTGPVTPSARRLPTLRGFALPRARSAATGHRLQDAAPNAQS